MACQTEKSETPQRRLKQFVEDVVKNERITKVQFAKRLGVDSSYLSKYTKDGGSIIRNAVMLDKLSSLGLNIGWYLNGTGEMYSNSYAIATYERTVDALIRKSGDMEIINEFVEVPTIESAFSCGKPEENEGDVAKIPVMKFMVEDIKNPYVLRCKGNSMEPVIFDGDYVIVETVNGNLHKLDNGCVVVACLNGEFTVKRFYRSGKYCVLVPQNLDKHCPYVFKDGDECVIIGVVRKRLTSV